MHQIVLTNTHLVVHKTRFITIYVEEITIVNCQFWLVFSCLRCSWLETHPNFINLGASGECCYNRKCHKSYCEQCASIWRPLKFWFCFKTHNFFGVNGVSTFQGPKTGVTIKKLGNLTFCKTFFGVQDWSIASIYIHFYSLFIK